MEGGPSTAPRIPGLEVVRPLGRGQMADVHLAREPELGRLVAVKVLRPDAVSTDPVARDRFEREARAVASLQHPNVVQIHRFGHTDDGRPYLVMQYVEGRSMADRLGAMGPLSEDDAREALAAVAAALEAAHRRGIVHRDVRPANVLVEEETGRVFLTDFGIAREMPRGGAEVHRLTQTGRIVGDPRFMSPEQLRGEDVTEQTDVYELGVLGYLLLSGWGPYGDVAGAALTLAHLEGEPRDLAREHGVAPALATLLHRCLAKDPARRPTTADVVRQLTGGREPAASAAQDLVRRVFGRRRIPQFVALAGGAGLALMEFVNTLQENALLPAYAFQLTVVFVAFGVAATVVVAWFHGERGRQDVPLVEVLLLGALTMAWLVASAAVVLV